ncbi:MAG: Fic family protein, partial [Acidobacteria bacterium]|nr:Fic family protein [Acidobacteriota bacterium]
MADKDSDGYLGATGFDGLIHALGLRIPEPAVRSYIVPTGRRTKEADGIVWEQYPRSYGPRDIIGHLKFALRYEPCHPGILKAVLKALGREPILAWLRDEPTGAYARRAWYLYEILLGETLDLPDVPPTGYVDLVDPELQVTAPVATRIRRQRINDNLLGSAAYSPVIRRTEELAAWSRFGLDREARTLIEGADPSVLVRAVNYLYTKETKSSFAIEGESPAPDRAERFVAALTRAEEFNPQDPAAFVRLQNAIVDPRYAERGWRTVQNFVGETRSDFTEHVHYVCPQPADVPELMRGWMTLVAQLATPGIDPVCAAAAAAFGFVFLHPLEDGNGRIHRFLIHHMLARAGFTPREALLPVSAVIARDRRAYDRVLAGYSRSIAPHIVSAFDEAGRLEVAGETADLYRYWDATPFAEYL